METEIFCLLVYDDDADMRADLRLILARYSIEKDVDLQIDWFSRPDQAEQIPRLIGGTQIALINAAMGETALQAGRRILEHAPDCLLAYYGGPQGQVKKLLSTRPAALSSHGPPFGRLRLLVPTMRASARLRPPPCPALLGLPSCFVMDLHEKRYYPVFYLSGRQTDKDLYRG